MKPNKQHLPDFGPNVMIFGQDMDMKEISEVCSSVFSKMESNHFGSERYALLFKPGVYTLPEDLKIGFYTQVSGLGKSPDDVVFKGCGVCSDAEWRENRNATCNFWRCVENLATGQDMKWAVSQAAPMRRVHIGGDITLFDGGWASGGFLADSAIDGTVIPGTQQQWFSRNSVWGGWKDGRWNTVFVGCRNEPSGTFIKDSYTVIDRTPLIREKPFLFLDGNEYKVFVPDPVMDSKGVSWLDGMGPGTVLPMDTFHIAYPEADTADTLNSALEQGKNLLFTPGIYQLGKTVQVLKANTVIMGMGIATLEPVNGNICMKIADVGGVSVSGLLFDAGERNSTILLQVGSRDSSGNHAANPVLLADLYFRVGGAGVGKCDASVEINSNNVLVDHFWVWRADHGEGTGWDVNTTRNGMVVNGNEVTAYGLFVEHYHEYQVLWNGNGGRVYFYQCEIPYDVPYQESWMGGNGEKKGFAAYKVSDDVETHEIWGSGVYCFFRHTGISMDSGTEAPDKPGVRVHNACTVYLTGHGEISHVVNNAGAAATKGAIRQTLEQYP